MADVEKYLVTVDRETRAPVKVEQVGTAGDLQEVPLESLQPARERASPTSPVINVYIDGQAVEGGSSVVVEGAPEAGVSHRTGSAPGCIIPAPRPPRHGSRYDEQ